MYYKLHITETGKASLKEESQTFNYITEEYATIEEPKTAICEKYGRMPNRKNKIYRENKNGVSEEVGFLYSFWSRYISHDSKSWYQTDWVEITSVVETTILI